MISKTPGGTALYLQIANELEQHLSRLRYGEQIPSESELMEQYQVSRGTIRQAINYLVSRGYLYKQHGKGTFRGNGMQYAACNRIPSYSSSLLLEGKIPAISHVTLQVSEADESSAHFLSVAVGEPIWLLSRFRGVQGEAPSCFAEAHIPFSILPALQTEDLEQSIIEMLTGRFGLQIASTTNSIYACAADKEMAERFQISLSAPLLVVDFVVRDPDGRPILYDRSIHWDQRFRYTIESA